MSGFFVGLGSRPIGRITDRLTGHLDPQVTPAGRCHELAGEDATGACLVVFGGVELAVVATLAFLILGKFSLVHVGGEIRTLRLRYVELEGSVHGAGAAMFPDFFNLVP